MSMTIKSIQENHEVYEALIERVDEGSDVSAAHGRIEDMSVSTAFREYMEWNGMIGYDTDVRRALWTLITSSNRYLTTTDHDREEWLKSMLGFGIDPA